MIATVAVGLWVGGFLSFVYGFVAYLVFVRHSLPIDKEAANIGAGVAVICFLFAAILGALT